MIGEFIALGVTIIFAFLLYLLAAIKLRDYLKKKK